MEGYYVIYIYIYRRSGNVMYWSEHSNTHSPVGLHRMLHPLLLGFRGVAGPLALLNLLYVGGVRRKNENEKGREGGRERKKEGEKANERIECPSE